MLSLLFGELLGDAWATHAVSTLLAIQCLFTVGMLVYLRRSVNAKQKLTPAELAQRIADYQPEPLVPDVPADHPALRARLISGRVGLRTTVDGVDCLNMASQNFLGLLDDSEATGGDGDRKAIECINENGVGACGPRGFYGTNEVHQELEERIASFMKCEEAAIYAYGFSALASTIPSYCKRGDLVFVDERVNFAIQRGLEMARSTVVYFRHNDAADLERLLVEQQQRDRRQPKKAAAQRRFLITEAIFQNTGEMCPLARLVQLRAQHKLRFILDESVSFGTVGRNGRGLTELLNIDLKEIDLIIGTLETAIGSIGGFCVGTTYIVDHQRLSGLAYCFSASAPPFLARVAIHALQQLEDTPQLVGQLNTTAEAVHESFGKFTSLTLTGHPLSPVKHLFVNHASLKNDRERELSLLRQIVDECTVAGLAITNAEYLENKERTPCPRPSVRIAVHRLLTAGDIGFAFETLERVSLRVLSADAGQQGS